MEFTKTKDFLLCIDSDGTVMDTMTVKHVNCFGPMFIKAMNINEHIDEILEHWNNTNLYTITRGINRFQGFYEVCVFIEKEYDYHFDGLKEFENWVTMTKEFSVNSIQEYMKTCSDNALFEKSLVWSKMVNDAIKNLPPSSMFDKVDKILETASISCDLVGVSSANKEAVFEEWNRLDLMKYFRFVGCQDVGNKAAIIKKSVEIGYSKKNVVMLGDAEGDLKAALANNVWFFPIIPRREKESWLKFEKEGLPILLTGNFNQDYQDKLIKEFHDSLK